MKVREYMELIARGVIPPEPADELASLDIFDPSYTLYMPLRDLAHRHGLYPLVDMQWTESLANWLWGRRVLEIMSGRGHLARALVDHGIEIRATDDKSWLDFHSMGEDLVEIEVLEATDAVLKYGDWADVLLVSWPPYEGEAVCAAAEVWGPGKPIVYIGEGRGGCTANDEFHDCLSLCDEPVIEIPTWPGIHDKLFVGYYYPQVKGE